MLPGPKYLYKCPNCGNLLTKGSLMSGNTFGAKVFSDGKRIAPMLPDFPDLTKCKKCDTIFWLSKLKELGTYEWGDQENLDWQNADEADFLGIEDYFKALDKGLALKRKEEITVRNQIWWAYNDRIREGDKIFKDESDELRWEGNANKLLTLLKPSNLNEKIVID